MKETTSRITISGKPLDFIDATLKNSGDMSASQLSIAVAGEHKSFRKYYGNEVIAYLNQEDTYPFFRGYVMNIEIMGEKGVRLIALDALGWLTGHQKATVFVTDSSNIDGYTVGGALKKLVKLANLDSKVGTDYIGDTSPIVTVRNNTRGKVEILEWLKKVIGGAIDVTTSDLPRPNTVLVRDDGQKGQINIELVSDIDNSRAVHKFNRQNLINYNVKARKIPTTITVDGANGLRGTYRNASAALAYGENFKNIRNDNMKSPAACVDFGRKVFDANVSNQYEIVIETFEGAYLLPNDVISIEVEESDISGKYRIIGKDVNFSPNKYSVTLSINRRPPILSDFIA
jgi:hypothetical protein